MPEWPPITEPELLERLAMDGRRFREFVRAFLAGIPSREYGPAALERALGYPWSRPVGSFVLTGAGVEMLGDKEPGERERTVAELTAAAGGRSPLLAIGSNAAPAALARKLAHFPSAKDRTVLGLAGRVHDFDVGASAQPALYGSLPATLFPSPGTAVGATVLWVTPAQLTQLTWSELSYRLGRLRARFEPDGQAGGLEEVPAFVSRFGAFCVDGAPVAQAAVPAERRTAAALTQEQLLDAAAALVLGDGAGAAALVRAVFEDIGAVGRRFEATVHPLATPFASERWAPFVPGRGR